MAQSQAPARRCSWTRARVAALCVREFLRYRCLALRGLARPRRIYASLVRPRSAPRLVSRAFPKYRQHIMKVMVPRIKRAASVLAVAVLLACCTRLSNPSEELKAEKDRKPAPSFSLIDSSGKPVTLADYRGKVVLLNFWATWCGPCEIEIPWFVEFEQKYKDRDFAVLGVSFDDDGWKSVRPFVAAHKINYRVMIGSEKMSQLYGGIDSLPTSFILDRQGRIAAQHVGLIDKGDYRNEILKLLDDQHALRAILLLWASLACFAQTNVLNFAPPKKVAAKMGAVVEAPLTLELSPGYHVNSNIPSDEYLIPLRLTWNAGPLQTAEVVSQSRPWRNIRSPKNRCRSFPASSRFARVSKWRPTRLRVPL